MLKLPLKNPVKYPVFDFILCRKIFKPGHNPNVQLFKTYSFCVCLVNMLQVKQTSPLYLYMKYFVYPEIIKYRNVGNTIKQKGFAA